MVEPEEREDGRVQVVHVHGFFHRLETELVGRAVDRAATLLHLLGFDHKAFTYRYAGRDFRLTDVYGNVVKDILA